MVVECPKCKKRYRVEDAKVPAGGAPVRCPSCENIFTIYREPLEIELIPIEAEVKVAPPEVMVPPPAVEAAREVEAVPRAGPVAPLFVKPAEVEVPVDEGHDRAKRLARSLVKDIVLYHPREVEIGLREGRLSELVGNEIRKSWKYYKERIPKDVVDSTNYFKDALNEILCRGKKIFT